jgi:prevent-host-death family protein
MHLSKRVGKREFVHHTSKYLKWVETQGEPLVITHHNKPDLVIAKIKSHSFEKMRGFADVKVHGDINEPILLGYDEW